MGATVMGVSSVTVYRNFGDGRISGNIRLHISNYATIQRNPVLASRLAQRTSGGLLDA